MPKNKVYRGLAAFSEERRLELEDIENLPTPTQRSELTPSDRLLLQDTDAELGKSGEQEVKHSSGLRMSSLMGDVGKPFTKGERRRMPLGHEARKIEAVDLVKNVFNELVKDSGEDSEVLRKRIKGQGKAERRSLTEDESNILRNVRDIFQMDQLKDKKIESKEIQDILKLIPSRFKS